MELKDLTWRWYRPATNERISRETFGTNARGYVVNRVANGGETTGTGTGVSASLSGAGSVAGTIGIDRALWSTIRWTPSVIW